MRIDVVVLRKKAIAFKPGRLHPFGVDTGDQAALGRIAASALALSNASSRRSEFAVHGAVSFIFAENK